MKQLSLVLLVATLLAAPLVASAQKGTYEIKSRGSVTDVSMHIAAMDAANFDIYRRVDERRTLNFEGGLVVELLSVREIQSKGLKVDESVADKSGGSAVSASVFDLHPTLPIIMENAPSMRVTKVIDESATPTPRGKKKN